MDSSILYNLILIVIGIISLIAVFGKTFKHKGGIRTVFMVIGFLAVAYGVVGLGAGLEWWTLPTSVSSLFLSVAGPTGGTGEIVCPTGTTLTNGICVSISGGGATYQPTVSYSAKDKYSTTSISGTSYYKVNSNSAITTAYTNANVGDQITYWVSNSTYWVKPVIKGAGTGVTTFEALGWANSSATVTLYDTVNRQSTTDGAYNTSLGANALANVEITYQGTAQGSSGPFGGVMVVEYNATISSVTCTGSAIMSSNPYHLTYSVSATSHTYKAWAYSSELDDGSATVQRINCQFKNGATAVGAGSPYYVKFIPANYYVTDAGDIVLDTEKNADGDTTRVGSTINSPTASAFFGA